MSTLGEMGTLADLQRRNLQKMEARQAPGGAEAPAAIALETGAVVETPVPPASAETDQSYDNMTNKLPDRQPDQKESRQERKPTRKKAGTQKAAPQDGPSVADLIRQRAGRRPETEVLKTVTLKLSPTLDERVERFCFENKMKKQDFWAEAAALYFETIEAEEGLP